MKDQSTTTQYFDPGRCKCWMTGAICQNWGASVPPDVRVKRNRERAKAEAEKENQPQNI